MDVVILAGFYAIVEKHVNGNFRALVDEKRLVWVPQGLRPRSVADVNQLRRRCGERLAEPGTTLLILLVETRCAESWWQTAIEDILNRKRDIHGQNSIRVERTQDAQATTWVSERILHTLGTVLPSTEDPIQTYVDRLGLQPAKRKTEVQGGGPLRRRWICPTTRQIYEQDSQHLTLEVYDRQGRHMREIDPVKGVIVGGALNRRVEP